MVIDILGTERHAGVEIEKRWFVVPSMMALGGHGFHRTDHEECAGLVLFRRQRRRRRSSSQGNDGAEKIVYVGNGRSMRADGL